MSQEQPRKAEYQEEEQQSDPKPIKYGDVFEVSGELKENPIAPGDAALMQSTEARVLEQPQPGGPADAMQYAAAQNLSAGLVGQQDMSDIARTEGVTVMETDFPGTRIVIEAVGGQILGQFAQTVPVPQGVAAGDEHRAKITIGEALEATAKATGNKPIDQSDAAAIQAAEFRATGTEVLALDGIGTTAQAAVAFNVTIGRDDDKVKIADILQGATTKMASDKVVTREDAEGVMSAEMHYNPDIAMRAGGVAATIAKAATINEKGGNDAST